MISAFPTVIWYVKRLHTETRPEKDLVDHCVCAVVPLGSRKYGLGRCADTPALNLSNQRVFAPQSDRVRGDIGS